MAIRLSALGVVLIALVAVWTQPDFLDRCGLNLAFLSELREQRVRAGQRRDVLDRHAEVIKARICAKQKVVHELLAGRIAFLQAARQFKDLNETPITCQDDYRSGYPGGSDGEKVCRQVLWWIEADLQDLPQSQAQALRRKLEEELAENLRRNGGVVVLP